MQFVMTVTMSGRETVLFTGLLQLLKTLRYASLHSCAYVVYTVGWFYGLNRTDMTVFSSTM